MLHLGNGERTPMTGDACGSRYDGARVTQLLARSLGKQTSDGSAGGFLAKEEN